MPPDNKEQFLDTETTRKRLAKLGFSKKTIPAPDFNEAIREIRRGNTERGLTMLKQWTTEWKGMTPQLYCLGLVMAGRYDEAMKCASVAIKSVNSVTYYSQIGICYWLQGEYKLAKQAWEDGALHSQYRDAAGGLELPLLIYASSLIRSDDPKLYKNRLLLAYDACRKMYWPSHLVRYVLGMENMEHPLAEIVAMEERYIAREPHVPSNQRRSTKLKAVLAFYRSIVALENGNIQEYTDRIHDSASYQECEEYAEWWVARDIVQKGLFKRL